MPKVKRQVAIVCPLCCIESVPHVDWWVQGVLRMGQEIEVRPGIVSKDSEGRSTCTPIYSRIVSLFTEQNELQYAVPGGLIGVGTTVRIFLFLQQ